MTLELIPGLLFIMVVLLWPLLLVYGIVKVLRYINDRREKAKVN